ncbi:MULTISPECIES: DUF3093 domain-containing protein [Microbacterium]|nr:DUF3093 domain-containing protein [Microbacterium saccharophilum]SFI32866.1 Protein of unknown function [Microbacterium saccharophilum]
MTAAGTRPAAAGYRERLSPSLWALVGAAVGGPMIALVFVPIDATLALVIGAVAGIALVAGMILMAPVVAVHGGELRVGRAHIDVADLGDPVGATGEDARQARGPGLSRDAWHLLRGGVDGVVRVPVRDAEDPVTEWVFSTRTPDRVIAAIRRAQSVR